MKIELKSSNVGSCNFLASQDALEVIFVSVTELADFTDVTLVSDDIH